MCDEMGNRTLSGAYRERFAQKVPLGIGYSLVLTGHVCKKTDAAGESWESVVRAADIPLRQYPLTPTAPVLARSGGGDGGARKKSCSYGATPPGTLYGARNEGKLEALVILMHEA